MKKDLALSFIGAGSSITLLSLLTPVASLPLLGSMGASAALVFGMPKAPLSQFRNIVLSHPISCVSALCVRFSLDGNALGAGLSVGVATVAMLMSRTFHPPAGGTALIVATSDFPEIDLLTSASLGALSIACMSEVHKRVFHTIQ